MSKLNLTQAGKRLGRSRTTVSSLIESGKIVAEIDPANGWRVIDESEIERFLNSYRPYVPVQKVKPLQPSQG